ncbi:MAG: fibronectin type III domain-containing protein, partial [Candidatus Sumerlaeota bacterium]|nr:fibronectin type III domain-containing protein [Candidatus Sumerlaeota bacterium]
ANTGLFTSDILNDNLLFSLIESNQDLRKLKVSNGDKVMAYYFPLGSPEITTTTLFQTVPVQVILNKPVYIGTHEIALITVNDNDANPNPDIAEAVNVTVTSDADPSGFILTLTETDIDTGIFTISKESNLLSFRPMGSNPALSQLKVNDGGQIHVAYTRPHTGNLFTAGAIWGRGPIYARFEKKYYYTNATGARLTVEDEDMNLNPELADSFTVRLSSTNDTLGFDLTVFETGPDTGIFAPKEVRPDGSQILFSVFSTNPYINAIKVADGDVVMVACNKYVRTPVYATAFWGEALWVEKRPAVYIILGPREGEVIKDEDVTFQFTAAASFGVSIGDVPVRQLDYQTILLGYETTWGDWMQGTRRVYRNLPTGEYTFLVRCRNFKNLITPYTARRFYVYRTPKPPLIPPQLVVTPEDTDIRLNWSMTDAGNLFGFNIYRREEGKSKVLLNSSLMSTSATLYLDIPVIPRVRYEYIVRAINKEGLIKDSNAMWAAANEDYRGNCILQFNQGYINMGNNLNEITIQVTNASPTETIYWSLYSDNPALSVYPPSGASLGEVSEFKIKLDRHTFSPGVYTLPLYIRSNAASYLPDIVNQSNTLVVAFNIPGNVEHVGHRLWEYDACPQPEAEGAPPIKNVLVDVSPLDLDCNGDPYIPHLVKAPIENINRDCPGVLNVNLRHRANGGLMPSGCPDLGVRRAITVSDRSLNGDGNMNGQIDAGELVTMRITLNNEGSVESRSLSFVLYSDDPYVEVLGNPMYVLNNVPPPPDPESTKDKVIYFHIADNLPYTPDGYTFNLYCLMVDTDGYDWLTSFPLKAYNLTPIKLIRYAIDDDNLGYSRGNGNGKLDPNEYIELPVTVFNATKVTLPRMPLLLDQETTPPVEIDFRTGGRKLIHTPGSLQPQSSTTPDEEFEFPVPNDYNGDEVHFRLRSFNVQPYLYDSFCPDPDFVVNLGYKMTDPFAGPDEPSQLPVYGIPYRYLSSQRFVVSPRTTLESDVTFDEIDGWSQSGEVKPFKPPLFGHDNGTISLKATSNTNCFGYWDSPTSPTFFTYPIVKDNLYCATFTFYSDQDNPMRTPGIRMRIYDDIFQQSDDFHIFSESSGSFSVGRGARKYPHYFIPNQFAGNALECAFDIINMNPTDAANGTVYLDEITVARRSFDYLPLPTLIREYTFDKDKEGWIFATFPVPFPFTTPLGGFSDNGYLYINGVDSNTFGFWCSPLDDVVLNENIRIYCAEFIVRKDHNTLQQNMPRVRFRLNSMDNQSAVSKTIDSTSEGKASPIDTDQSYKIFILSPTDKDGKPIQDVPLQAAVDFINLSPFDESKAKLIIDGVNIYVYPPDIIP